VTQNLEGIGIMPAMFEAEDLRDELDIHQSAPLPA
jgi:hypothetical protein